METTLNIFAPENSSNQTLGAQIRQQIEELALNFIQIDDQEKTLKRNKKSIILEMADKFERLHELGEFPLPINHICSSLYRYLQRKGFDISDRYIQLVLSENAPQYTNSSTYHKVNLSEIDIKFEQDEIMEALKTLKNANLNVLKSEQIQDLVPDIFETAYQYEDFAHRNGITPSPNQQAQQAHYDAEELDPFRDTIVTDKPDPRSTPSTLAEATMFLGETILKCGDTIINTAKMMELYPPNEDDLELEKDAVKRVYEWATFWEMLTSSLKNGTDRKYRRSVIQWKKIADDESDFGKHASASKNPYISKFKDKNGEWKEEIRRLTREQIGDRAPKAREFALLFKRSVPACYDMIKWAEVCMFPFASGLSTKLHDKLSERSLR